MKPSEQLKERGYKREDISWSFTPQMYSADEGRYYSKFIPVDIDEAGVVSFAEIGVIVNDQYNTMEVYMCDCFIGCCGEDLGVHPFSIDKIAELSNEFLIEYSK